MMYRSAMGLMAVVLLMTSTAAQAFDESKYPNWKDVWQQVGSDPKSPWDPSKPPGLAGQQAPLSPEYRAVFEASVKSEAEGGLAVDPAVRCTPAAMPRVMMAVEPMEMVITPSATYFFIREYSTQRRIYTDGRKFPDDVELTYAGYSIGQWQDTDGDGKYDTLLVETRAIQGPHTYDSSGIPFHQDLEAVIKERIYADKANPDILHDEITTIDHALTRPWTVTRNYKRIGKQALLEWTEYVCTPDPTKIEIGDKTYKLSPEGLLMPVRQGQAPPDLKYFRELPVRVRKGPELPPDVKYTR
jgi:hypothetical protein